MQLQRRCKCLPSTPANGFYCFTTNLCNFDELATTILLHIHVKTFGLNFQRLAEKFRVAQRKKNTKSETFAKNFRRKRAKTQRPEVEEPSKAVRMCILKTIFFLPYTTAPNLAFTKMTHKFRLFFKLFTSTILSFVRIFPSVRSLTRSHSSFSYISLGVPVLGTSHLECARTQTPCTIYLGERHFLIWRWSLVRWVKGEFICQPRKPPIWETR